MALQTADVLDAITRASGTAPAEMRVDGGASVMDLLCQFQADLLGVPVRRAAIQETTALGAAFLAGLAEGVWDSPATVNATWRAADASFTPAMADDERAAASRAMAPRRRTLARLGPGVTSGYDAADSGVRASANEAMCAVSVGMSSAVFVAYVSTYS